MRYVCIHAHFYQPPRENPWLEVVERQDSAHPYHDWNERVHAECYWPNAAARVLDAQGRIERIVDNYQRISFNVGPTLLAWMEQAHPDTYRAILEADRISRRRRAGAGAALAQVHGHVILPLANERDKRTQIRWGIRDFEHRFGRRPRGMWLSETAVDTATLEALAAAGIEFTILAPHQCRRVRHGDGPWLDVEGGRVDPRRPYRVELPSGRSVVVFFYDGPTARAVAFERLLDDGATFVRRLLGLFDPDRAEPQIVHIATDGETYGHHHRFGEMALAWALSAIEREPGVRLTTYEEFLDRHPPEWQAEIVEPSSWSCAHGVERWRADCGCRAGGPPRWSQAWRAPLREALDWLRDELAVLYEAEGSRSLRDPWAARDAYIDVVLDRRVENVRRFLAEHAAARNGSDPLDDRQSCRVLELLEMQRHAMSMYTSCGWFFDDLGGIEAVQVVRYAARALQIATHIAGDRFEGPFLERLARARSNRPELGDGRNLYETLVRPAMVDLRKVGAHFAASSLFEEYRSSERVFGFDVDVLERDEARAGRAHLGIGRIAVRSRATWASETFEYAAVHLGDHNLSGGVRPSHDEAAYAAMKAEIRAAFGRADLAEVLRAIERHFAGSTYTLRTLFRDEQKKILDEVLASTLAGVESNYAQIYEQFAPLMRYLASLGQPVPKALHQAGEYTLTARLRRQIERGRDFDLDLARTLANEARDAGVALQMDELGLTAQGILEDLLAALQREPDDPGLLEAAARLAGFAVSAGLRFERGVCQNRFYELREEIGRARLATASADPGRQAWVRAYQALGDALGVRVD